MDSASLSGKTAIVTGAGRKGLRPDDIGSGFATAVTLAREGCSVALVDSDELAARRTQELIVTEGGRAEVFVGDVSDGPRSHDMVEAAAAELGAPLILVNNVGILGPPGSAMDVDETEWDHAMRVNVKSMMLMAKWTLPYMCSAGTGAIVNISSVAGMRANMDEDLSLANLLYPTSKGAIISMTRSMAAHHGRAGIRVNAVAPGAVYSAMVNSRMSPVVREARRVSSMLRTEGTPWDIANAVLFLVGDRARWITGTTLVVNAGSTAARYTVGDMH